MVVISKEFIIYVILSLVLGYAFGSIPVGYLVAKSKNVDIFNVGSKNPGSTNVGRVLGKKYGNIVFVLDLVKTVIPILLSLIFANFLLKNGILNIPENIGNVINSYTSILSLTYITYRNILIVYTGSAAVIGHNFPFTTSFRGGKGITCTLAVIACFNIWFAILDYLFHFAIKKITKYVSLASILALVVIIIVSISFTALNIYPFNFEKAYIIVPPLVFISLLGIIRHKDNIKRLIAGKENKTL